MSNVKKYYYLAKPGIVYGNGITTIAGFLFASKGHVDFILLLTAVVGSSLVIAAGCVVNNFIDRDIDKKMVRTAKRALPRGDISNVKALSFGAILGIAGFSLLGFRVNLLTVWIGLVGLIDYLVFYSYFKRHSIHGTLVGTVAGATPIAAGYCAVTGSLDATAIMLFLIMTAWQMPHFFAIAIYRFKDYKKAGICIWPVKKGIVSTKIQIALYISVYIALILLLALRGYAGISYMIAVLIMSLWWFRQSIQGFSAATDDNKWGRKLFGSSLIVLMVFCLMISIDNFLP